MAKQKHTWRQPHRYKVHDNRWLMWAISIMIMVSAVLIGYIQIIRLEIETDSGFYRAVFKSWSEYQSESDNYSFKYPKGWAFEAENDATVSLVNPNDFAQYFSVSKYRTADESAVRASLLSSEENRINLNGVSATAITVDKRQAEQMILIRQGRDLFVIRARGAFASAMISSFKFNTEILTPAGE